MISNESKSRDIEDVVQLLRGLSPLQVDVVHSIIERFSEGLTGQLLRQDFLNAEAYEFFGIRLSAHHATSAKRLKKENFEHILEQAFVRSGIPAKPSDSMTERGADLKVGDVSLSLKTESAKGLKAAHITISKLMEAAWIKKIVNREDIPPFIKTMVVPHFANYARIFILRSYLDPLVSGHVRYDLHEIPKNILQSIDTLVASDFSKLTQTRTTRATVLVGGKAAFKFCLVGSDD